MVDRITPARHALPSLAALAVCFGATAARADPLAPVVCHPRAEMAERLARTFGAELAGTGLRGPDSMIEVWTDPRGAWALVETHATGRACIVALGEGWESLPPPASG